MRTIPSRNGTQTEGFNTVAPTVLDGHRVSTPVNCHKHSVVRHQDSATVRTAVTWQNKMIKSSSNRLLPRRRRRHKEQLENFMRQLTTSCERCKDLLWQDIWHDHRRTITIHRAPINRWISHPSHLKKKQLQKNRRSYEREHRKKHHAEHPYRYVHLKPAIAPSVMTQCWNLHEMEYHFETFITDNWWIRNDSRTKLSTKSWRSTLLLHYDKRRVELRPDSQNSIAKISRANH